MQPKVLTNAQIEQFIELGYVHLEEAFPRKAALAAQDYLWAQVEKRGVLKQDRSTWNQPMVHIREQFDAEEFQACNTLRLADAIEDVVGAGRWKERSVYGQEGDKTLWGWWPVNFAAGADQPWDVPTNGWHWDGMSRPHYVDSPEQGLLLLCIFSDIGLRSGSTLVAEGSHKIVSKLLAEHGDGPMAGEAIQLANRSHPWLRELTNTKESDTGAVDVYADGAAAQAAPAAEAGNRVAAFMEREHADADGFRLRVAETPASAGDVLLCHPFLYHCASQNHSGVPRFMCNRATPLVRRMNLNRANPAEYSPLELSVRQSFVRA
ncbi:Phytanoyl-CoA dioxygenase (PhyH) [Paenibacillus sp. UNC496MF]|uniref:phytanoyl-CoA dioxygenase family protein n=1 Tax=Paenibacillus sp. UNC496MF TaxID=1502753 RepID=UPI0008E0E001|nr:phytanoyl-CoA dioxygenase family protein [Paenibacillus sp. UNC496MF]SFI38035.1 Phytanoyl-CoA dioxygenase (PhyH) [Paenibacillus sp. UNC496MF]